MDAVLNNSLVIIKDPADLRLAAYRSLKGKELEKDGIFVAEGEKVVKCMLESDCRIASCLTSSDAIPRYRAIISDMAKRKVPVYILDNSSIESIIGFRFHKGIMAIGYCPKKLTVREALKPAGRRVLLVALNAVNDPQNVGLIARNAAAFDANALVVDHATYDPYYRKAIRVSMGTIFGVPVCYEKDLGASLAWLKKNRDIRVIAATLGRKTEDIRRADLSGSVCLVFGNEDKGISPGISRLADARVSIPISKSVDSLNVAGASAVFLYEVARRTKNVVKYNKFTGRLKRNS